MIMDDMCKRHCDENYCNSPSLFYHSHTQDYKSSSSTIPPFSHIRVCSGLGPGSDGSGPKSRDWVWFICFLRQALRERIQAIHCASPKMISCIICQWEAELLVLAPHGAQENLLTNRTKFFLALMVWQHHNRFFKASQKLEYSMT